VDEVLVMFLDSIGGHNFVVNNEGRREIFNTRKDA
jgi:hypothetical protein